MTAAADIGDRDLNENWASEMRSMFKQLQDDTLLYSLPGLLILGVALFATAPFVAKNLWCISSGTSLILLGLVIWFVRKVSFRLASWVLVVGCLGVTVMVITWGRVNAAAYLLIIPVGLTTLTLGARPGVSMGILSSLFLILTPAGYFGGAADLRLFSLITVWTTLGLIWLALHPLLTSVQWAWAGYRRSMALLERSRESQVKLAQMVEDYTDANTQLTRMNQLAQNLRHEAEEERRVKEEFVANVSHELRTPLNMIVGFCGMILDAPATYGENIPPSLLADLQVVLRNSQHLSSLIDDVLDLSQIDTNHLALTKEYVSLQEVIGEAVTAVRPLFSSKNLYLNTEIAPDLPALWCDSTRIREVLLNLFSNAGRFTEKGGITLKAWQDSTHVVVSVTDTGLGIAEEDMHKIFRPFQQVDGSIRRRFGGSGLGLSISKNIVELHDGKMWVESQKGVGTTFFFKLPFNPIPTPPSNPARWLSPYRVREERARPVQVHAQEISPRVAVVENGTALQKMLSRYLQNIEVVALPSLEAAVIEIARTPVMALLVNDIQVSQVLDRLEQPGVLPYSLPAIVCSIPGIEQASGVLGVANYLVKPIARDDLLSAIEALNQSVETILLVDDEPDARQLFRRMLASSPKGYQVLRASDGQHALQIMRSPRIHLVLLDLMMPRMNGFQFLAAKNQEAELSQVPVILISARDPQGHPIASNGLAVTRGGGLSMHQVLSCIEALSAILSPVETPAAPTPPQAAPE